MATQEGNHAGSVLPEMESTLDNRTTDSPFVGDYDANLGEPAAQQVMSFAGLLEDVQTQVQSAGYNIELWAPEFGWTYEEEEASEDPFPAQVLAAFQCFQWLFTASIRRAWVHIAAEMQAGKTGVVTAFIRLVLKNFAKLRIHHDAIFVLTGMSDDAWKVQTRKRLPMCLRNNVHHNGSLHKVAAALRQMASRNGGLQNVLIVLDESHIASAASNRPNKLIYDTLRELVPDVNEWITRNICIVTISATDPAKVLMMEASEVPCRVVRLQTTHAYQSVRTLYEARRVRAVEEFGDIHTEKAMAELKRVVSAYTTSRYHILRVRAGQHEKLTKLLERTFPRCNITCWDASRKTKPANESGSVSTLDDINELLATEPTAHHFILIKNMFYAAKTVDDSFVGVLWDRISSKDDTTLQSLLGRACGYGKSTDTLVYCSSQTVKNYVDFWKELCSNPEFPKELNVPVRAVDRRMAGISARATSQTTSVVELGATAGPLGGAGGPPRPARNTHDEHEFTAEWREFATLEEANAWAPSVGKKLTRDEEGFILSAVRGDKERLPYAKVKALQGGKKTGGFSAGKLESGKSTFKLYICYRDTRDINSVVFVVGKLTRK